jgi:NarL family two-component system response regulator LiaR
MNTIVVIDDHRMMRAGLLDWLSHTGQWTIQGEASTLEEARVLFNTLSTPPDLVLLDISLQEESGLDIIPWLKEKYPPSPGDRNLPGDRDRKPAILVYSVFQGYTYIQEAMKRGAMGYVCKTDGDAEFAAALEAVMQGKSYIDQNLAKKIFTVPDILIGLTRREREILQLVQAGMDNPRIVKKLSLELRTVENYLSRLYDKTGAKNRTELMRL